MQFFLKIAVIFLPGKKTKPGVGVEGRVRGGFGERPDILRIFFDTVPNDRRL